MTPEDRVNEYVLFVLNNIKEELLLVGEDKQIEYEFTRVVGTGIPSKDTEIKILRKLESYYKAIKILELKIPNWEGPRGYAKLKAIQPRFNEVYSGFLAKEQPADKSNKIRIDPSVLHTNLQRRFESFTKLSERGFFLGVADYVQYIDETPEFEPILLSIKKLREQNEQKLNELEVKLKKDIEKVASEIFSLIKKGKIKSDVVDKSIDEYKGVVEGRIQSTATDTESLNSHLEGVIRALHENGHKELVSKFLKTNPESGLIVDYIISDFYYPYRDELAYFRSLMKTTLWGSWNELVVAYLVTHQYRREMATMDTQKDFWRQMNFHALHKEMQKILDNERDDSERIHFVYDDYLVHINRVHNYFVEQLLSMASRPLSYPEDEIQEENDQWLNKKDKSTLQKIWRVVFALNSEWQLRDQDTFKIPLEKFVKDWIDNEGELEAILTNLHNRKIIEVSRKLGETPPSDDPNKPQGSIWATINDQPEIIRREDTQIKIFSKKFSGLVSNLTNRIANEIEDAKEVRQSTAPPSDNQLRCSGLLLDLDQGIIQYRDNSPVEISPDNSVVKMLIFLIRNEKVAEYIEIAKSLEMGCWYEGATNKDVARDVQFLRRDLATFLRDKVGMSEQEIQDMIITKKNLGYKLRCV